METPLATVLLRPDRRELFIKPKWEDSLTILDRTQPMLPLKAKKPWTWTWTWSNEYVRHG